MLLPTSNSCGKYLGRIITGEILGFMLFTSPLFIFFFLPIVFWLHLLLPQKYRNYCILAASLLFYYYGEATLALLLVFSIIVNFALGKYIESIPREKPVLKSWVLFLCLAFNIGLLGYFKYANFFVLDILGVDAGNWSRIALPMGISFFTFQCMSYVIDIYKGRIASQPDLVAFGTYISCFPQLIAGPIVRYEEIAASLGRRLIGLEDIFEGCRRFAIGLGKKMLIANPMGYVADKIYAMPPECLDAPNAWLAIACYSLQIYYDFSGYSDMAIGLGRMIGFHFPENFNYPYSSNSIKDFWRRWHMTLTRWLRDYVYIPLGGSRVAPWRTAINKWTVFLLCGLWHGASWNFIVWGLYHGFFIVAENFVPNKITTRMPRLAGYFYAILVVALGWVVFRADSLDAAMAMYKAAFGFGEGVEYPLTMSSFWRADLALPFIAGIFGCFPMLAWLEERLAKSTGQTCVDITRYALILGFFAVSLSFSFSTSFNPFLYFRF